jgi:hypothetical protein
MDGSKMLVGFYADVARGMKPGTPVFTTGFSLCLVSMPLIWFKASSGRAEMSKFSLARAALRAVEVAKSGFQRISGCGYRHGCIGYQGAKAECGDMAAFVVERYSLEPKIRRFCHRTPLHYFAPCIKP